MPQIPLIEPAMPGNSGGAMARVSPVAASAPAMQAVRADPNLNAPVYAGTQQLAGAIGGVSDLAFRVKHASDSAHITRAQLEMEAANLDFLNWTKTNPDPETWQPELDARMAETKTRISEQAAGQKLSPMAQQRLGLTLQNWEVSTQKRVQLQATEQRMTIAAATYNDYVSIATAANDLPAVESKVDEGVQNGIYNAKTGQSIKARARQQIHMNQVNGLIEADPFEAEKRLRDNSAFAGMSDTMRQTLIFRARKAAAGERANIQKEWAHMVREAQEGNGPMPDKDGIMEEAKRIGVAPAWVDRLFKTPQATDPKEFARTFSAIATYNPEEDPTGERLGEIEAQIESFKGPSRERLSSLVTAKLKPEDPMNTPVGRAFFQRAAQDRSAGIFLPGDAMTQRTPQQLDAINTARGRYAAAVKDAESFDPKDDSPEARAARSRATSAKTALDAREREKPGGPRDRANWETRATEAERDSESLRYADYLTKMRAFLVNNPKATDIDAENYARELRKPYVMQSVSATLASRPAPGAAPVSISTKEEYDLLPPGSQFIWQGRAGTKPAK